MKDTEEYLVIDSTWKYFQVMLQITGWLGKTMDTKSRYCVLDNFIENIYISHEGYQWNFLSGQSCSSRLYTFADASWNVTRRFLVLFAQTSSKKFPRELCVCRLEIGSKFSNIYQAKDQ